MRTHAASSRFSGKTSENGLGTMLISSQFSDHTHRDAIRRQDDTNRLRYPDGRIAVFHGPRASSPTTSPMAHGWRGPCLGPRPRRPV